MREAPASAFIFESHSVMPDSLQPQGLYSPWNSPGPNTGVGTLSLLQGNFLTQESKRDPGGHLLQVPPPCSLSGCSASTSQHSGWELQAHPHFPPHLSHFPVLAFQVLEQEGTELPSRDAQGSPLPEVKICSFIQQTFIKYLL
ncbi:unnamed protein product [Rangifer tarandus platyrhynchus]|uniref:Uncharacterized protein n=1 Tax=Rangifer tarandus platyrhynchus TaxID=3082113 RepID=A0ABN9A273_RANTA|nr:unnamed protein product [Rangifer tarandus platyrhynchus]